MPKTAAKKKTTSKKIQKRRDGRSDGFSLSAPQKLEIYHYMLLNYEFEQRVVKLYKQGKVAGGVYTSRGQEGNTIASCYALKPEDVCAPMIRNSGAILLRGLPAREYMANYLGRETGTTKGRDANNHLGSMQYGLLAPISHLGSMIPLCTGIALAFKMKKEKRVAMTWIGDGGSSTGVFHEGLNFAAVQQLPFVLILENNQYAYSTPIAKQTRGKYVDRALGYGIEGVEMDGNDVVAVYQTTKRAVEKARSGGGPTLIVSNTMRMEGHAIHDDASYVPKKLRDEWEKKDPIGNFKKLLTREKILSPKKDAEIRKNVMETIDDATEFALNEPFPDGASAEQGVYAD